MAISAFIRTIISSEAPFQKWLEGDIDMMTDAQKEGAILFFGKAKCYNCHYEKNLGSHEFHALGVKDMDQNDNCFVADKQDRRNKGRAGFTLADEDLFKFRVPGLYNVGDYSHYFHGSSKTSIDQVIDYKLEAKVENSRIDQSEISSKLHPIVLSDQEKYQLKVFLEQGLSDPGLDRYIPDHVGSGNCFPNNDPISQVDLDCH